MLDTYNLFTVLDILHIRQLQDRMLTDFGLKYVVTVEGVLSCKIRSKINTKIVFIKKKNMFGYGQGSGMGFNVEKTTKKEIHLLNPIFSFTGNKKVELYCEML